MTPRNQIHALDLAAKPSQVAQQLDLRGPPDAVGALDGTGAAAFTPRGAGQADLRCGQGASRAPRPSGRGPDSLHR